MTRPAHLEDISIYNVDKVDFVAEPMEYIRPEVMQVVVLLSPGWIWRALMSVHARQPQGHG